MDQGYKGIKAILVFSFLSCYSRKSDCCCKWSPLVIAAKGHLCWGTNLTLMQRVQSLFQWHKSVQDDCQESLVTPTKTNVLHWVLGIPSNICYFFFFFLVASVTAESTFWYLQNTLLSSIWPLYHDDCIDCSKAMMEQSQLLGRTWIRKVDRNS